MTEREESFWMESHVGDFRVELKMDWGPAALTSVPDIRYAIKLAADTAVRHLEKAVVLSEFRSDELEKELARRASK